MIELVPSENRRQGRALGKIGAFRESSILPKREDRCLLFTLWTHLGSAERLTAGGAGML
jgi:hypothetical protein